MCGAGSSSSGALGFPGAHHYRRNPRLRLVQFSGRWARRGYLRPRLPRRALGGPAEGDPAPRRWNPPGVSALRGVWGQMAPARGAPGRPGGGWGREGPVPGTSERHHVQSFVPAGRPAGRRCPDLCAPQGSSVERSPRERIPWRQVFPGDAETLGEDGSSSGARSAVWVADGWVYRSLNQPLFSGF